MTQHQVPQGSVPPPAEPFVALDDTVEDTTADVVHRSRRRTTAKIAAMIGAALVLVGAAVLVTVLVMRPDKPSPGHGMTSELAVAYVQDEFPGRFTNPDKLVALFKTNCLVLDAGGTRTSAIAPMLEAGLTSEESSYILDMAIYSTCPRYAGR